MLKKLFIISGILFTASSFAQVRQCTETQMKNAKRMDVRTDSSQMSSQIYNATNGEYSYVSLSAGYAGSASITVYFNDASNNSCTIKLKGVTLGFQMLPTAMSAPASQLTMSLLLSCASKFTRKNANPSLGGMEISSANGKTLGDLGLNFNASQNSVNLVTPITNTVLGGYGCGN